MVRTWNREPSPDQSKARRDASPKHTPTIVFHANNPRFAFDGKPKLANFLNGFDGQLAEARGSLSPVNTATHTRYDFSGTGAGTLAISLAAEMARSFNSIAILRSRRPKSATARSLVANDTRYSHLHEPHRAHVGPGAYDIERGLPSVGQMPLDSHTCSASPHRDPYRASAPFMAPQRPNSPNQEWVKPGNGPDAVYISPNFVPGPDRSPPWDVSTDERPDVAQWRLAHARVIAAVVAGAGRGGGTGAASVAPEAPFSSDLPIDVAGRPLEVSLRAAVRNPHGVSFTSKEPRLTALPPERTSDLRASRLAALRGSEDTAHLGPGSYTPPISVGGPRRRTYRVYVDPLLCRQPSDRFGGPAGADVVGVGRANGGRGSGNGGSGSGGSSCGRGGGGRNAQAEAAAVVAACERGRVRAAAAARVAAAAAAAAGSSPRGSISGCTATGGGGCGGGGRSLSARSRGAISSSGSVASAPPSRGGGGGGGSTTRLGGSSAFTGTFRGQKSGAFDVRTDSSLVKY